MIIFHGEIFPTSMQDELLSKLPARLNKTLAGDALPTENVVDALDALSREISTGAYDDIFATLPLDDPARYKQLAIDMLSRQNVLFKLQTELAQQVGVCYTTQPPHGLAPIKVQRCPLGTIFHIAAGNADGLPAFSLVEGLLTGNINILKLPQADNDLTLKIIFRLIQLEPALAPYVYVFDTPSTDIAAMQKMAALADGICVWGGEAAVASVRNLAPIGAKLIEFGHKLSFCYVSGFENEQQELTALARHIATTKQLLCSSCQTIFVDTDNFDEVRTFAQQFLPYLNDAMRSNRGGTLGERAHFTLLAQTERLEKALGAAPNPNEFRGDCCGTVAFTDSSLQLSPLTCTVPVKPLSRQRIVEVLRTHKDYLQTAGLICTPQSRNQLTQALVSCGVNRITRAGEMSQYFSGEAHDGEYPLARYTRIVNIQP